MSPTAPSSARAFTLHMTVDDATAAAGWYTSALGAVERSRITLPDGKLIHLELDFGPFTMMVADEFPAIGSLGPKALGGTYGALYLHVDDVQVLWDRAVAMGATVVRPLSEVFWGDLDGQIVDPFGHRWGLAQHLRDVSVDEMSALAAKAFGPTT
jgi:PhnB protein